MRPELNQLLEHLASSKAPFQLVKHIEDVPAAKIKYPAFAEVKEDGVYCAVIVDGLDVKYVSRTGKPLYIEPWLDTSLRELHMTPTARGIYITELVNPRVSLEVLSGLVNPNRKKKWNEDEAELMRYAQCVAHDSLSFGELLAGHSPLPYHARRKRMADNWRIMTAGRYVRDRQEFDWFAEEVIGRGDEGVVLKQHNADWEAGHKGWRVVKYVRGISLDLECIGYELGSAGTKREGQVTNLLMRYKGARLSIDLGAGWTDAKRIELTSRLRAWSGVPDPIYFTVASFGIFTVTALQESSTGNALRLPKVGPERFDKEKADE